MLLAPPFNDTISPFKLFLNEDSILFVELNIVVVIIFVDSEPDKTFNKSKENKKGSLLFFVLLESKEETKLPILLKQKIKMISINSKLIQE